MRILAIIKSWFYKPIIVKTSIVPVVPVVAAVEPITEVIPVIETVQPKEVKPTVSAKKPVGRPRKDVSTSSTVRHKANNFSVVHNHTVVEKVQEVYVHNDIVSIGYLTEPTVEVVTKAIIVEEPPVFSGFSESSEKLFGGAGATENFDSNPTVESVIKTESYTPSNEPSTKFSSYESSSYESSSESYTEPSSTDW